MIARDFISRLVSRLGNRTDLEPALLDIMNDVKETTLEKQSWYPWFLEHDTAEDSTHLVTVVGSELVQLPAGYLAQVEDMDVWLLDSAGQLERILDKQFYADMLQNIAATDSIQAYTLRGVTMRVRGIPTSVRNIRLQYYKADDQFTLGYENAWLKYAAAVVYGEVGFLCANKYVKDYEMAAMFEKDAARAWSELAKENTARAEAGVSRVKGD